METRINVFEKGQKAISTLFGISGYLKKSELERSLFELVEIRISQINNCAYCLDMHTKEAMAHGETTQRLFGLSAWKETPYFTQRERVALAYAEAVNACDVPDEIYDIAKAEFSEEELIDLTLAIGTINMWNRLNIAFANTPGTYRVGQFG
ncbi:MULTISPECIES: carboxymuconolactone decarboxylase family protein [Flavobacterium]|jgi:AhpD family alkylhydroperoxidase|uniref:Alkylhydroperoxidase AhpD family core domain-containing protein n=1 Tax=Flavobacterium resistens TaxID=443612 RepID=A0A521AUL5_9FLAO|nr:MULTISPECIES: carboxymuconolactone decarboxylase family protein [Flavobacterium]MRX68567.1 carboxymuconolactone decarboxylase family protein [Flavobacterium resistens]SMO38411.1 alkylhydroperoxidase AhpD family core domain-containing protein [Flavobacterium resistens]